jgi:phospholipase/carboxylesterase
MSLLPCVEIDPIAGAPDAAVIWLHGLGASGHDFEPIVPELGLPRGHRIRFVFPHAPSIPVTINNGMVMPAWYDILAMDLERKLDLDQLRASARQVHALIDREVENGVPSGRVLLAGFSQGGAVAYDAALTYPQRLCALLALSTYFATAQTLIPDPMSAGLPIEIHHGSHDGVVPELLGQRAAEQLRAMGYPVNYRRYSMEHAVCPAQIADIGRWMKSLLLA